MLEGEDTCSSLLNNGPGRKSFGLRTVVSSFQLCCQPFHNHSLYTKVCICVCAHACTRMLEHTRGESGIRWLSVLRRPVEQRSVLKCCCFQWILTLTKDPKETWLLRVKSDPSRQCGRPSEEHIYCDLSKGSFELAKRWFVLEWWQNVNNYVPHLCSGETNQKVLKCVLQGGWRHP